MEKVHRYKIQEDATYEKVKADQGEKINVHKDILAPYAKGQVLENIKY